MRKYFIDYFQLWFPFAHEEMKEPDVKVQVKNNIVSKLFSDDIRNRLVHRPTLSLESFFHVHFHHGGLIFHIKGLFFDSDTYSENISQVYSAIETIYHDHKSDFDFKEMTISRIDFACNLPFFLNTHEYKITKSSDRLEEFHWFIGEPKAQNQTGVQIGKRGTKGLQLSVYDKRYSPNIHDDHRFDTHNFTRLEYKIGRKYLKGELGIGTPKDLRKYEQQFPTEVLAFCRRRSDLSFKGEAGDRHYYSLEEFEDALGNKVENPDAEKLRVSIGDEET